jgi:hypothetical protein
MYSDDSHNPNKNNQQPTPNSDAEKQDANSGSNASANKNEIARNVTSERKIAANRANAQHSTGPRNTASSRYNATSHGLCARLLTPLDDREEFYKMIKRLDALYPLLNPLGDPLKEQAVLEAMRLRRGGLVEAENITAVCSPSAATGQTSDRHKPTIDPSLIDHVAKAFGLVARYDTSALNRLLKIMRQLELMWEKESDLNGFNPYIPSDSTDDNDGDDDGIAVV